MPKPSDVRCFRPAELPREHQQFGMWVVAIREQLGWDQATLAERSGVQVSGLSRIESGETPDPRLSTVLAIRAAFVGALRAKVYPSLELFLASQYAREQKIAPSEIEAMRAVAFGGAEEPTQEAWGDALRAIRALGIAGK